MRLRSLPAENTAPLASFAFLRHHLSIGLISQLSCASAGHKAASGPIKLYYIIELVKMKRLALEARSPSPGYLKRTKERSNQYSYAPSSNTHIYSC